MRQIEQPHGVIEHLLGRTFEPDWKYLHLGQVNADRTHDPNGLGQYMQVKIGEEKRQMPLVGQQLARTIHPIDPLQIGAVRIKGLTALVAIG